MAVSLFGFATNCLVLLSNASSCILIFRAISFCATSFLKLCALKLIDLAFDTQSPGIGESTKEGDLDKFGLNSLPRLNASVFVVMVEEPAAVASSELRMMLFIVSSDIPLNSPTEMFGGN